MKHIVLTFLLSCLIGISLQAQVLVTGVITEEGSDLPLIGVSVVEKGTTNGSITDFDGRYELSLLNSESTLVYSYIGYSTQEIVVSGSSTVDVSLEEDIAKLDEIVVIGYGVQKKAVVTGAISKVTSKALDDQPVARIEQSLQGRTSGVRVTGDSGAPGSAATVRIRGTTTIGNSNPLYVVDGVVIGGGIDFLSQGDIASIEVLKDAAAAAIYGARGANGVIIVTTKNGLGEKSSIGYNSYMGVQSPIQKLPLLNATEYTTLMNEASVAAGGSILYDDPSSYGEGTDWQDAIFNYNALMMNHELNLSSSSDKSSSYLSLGYYNQQGIVIGTAFQRFSGRINSTFNVNERLKVGTNLAYARVGSASGSVNSEWGSSLGRAINLDPLTPILETDPEVLESSVFTNFPVVVNEDGIPFGISENVTSEILNPVAAAYTGQGSGYSDKIVGGAFAELTILPGLSFKTKIGTDMAFWGSEGFTPIYYLNSSNQNTITRYNRQQNRGLFWIWENILKYDKEFGNHNIGITVGTVGEQNQGETIGGEITDIPVDNLEDASLGFSTSPESQTFWGYEYKTRGASYLGRINYNYAEKYLLSLTTRIDGSSSFGGNNKWGRFPAVSAGWVITDEKFLNSSNVLNFLKIRGSWGLNGNDRIPANRFVSTVGGGRDYTFGLDQTLYTGSSPDAISNPDLKWESTRQVNVGIDAKIFKKMSLTLDLFDKFTYDRNIAELTNKGVELEIGYGNKFKLVNYDISGNVSYVKNEITDLGPALEFLGGQTYGPSGTNITRTEVGYPIGFFYGYTTDGIFQNEAEVNAYTNVDGDLIQPEAVPGDFRWKDINGDGIIDDEDRGFIGDPTPNWTYGANLELTWGGFKLYTFGQGVAGNEIFRATRRWDLPMANMEGAALDRWTGEGSTNDYPRLTLNDTNNNFSRSSDFYLEPGGYFRIKNLQFGYAIPNIVLDRFEFEKLYFYVASNNLFTITNYRGFDPEIGGGSYGVDRVIYPQSRSFTVGINAAF